MAMGDERAHALRLCNSQCLSVVAYPAFGVELVRITRDFAKQAQRVGRGARLAPRGLDGAITEFPRLVLARVRVPTPEDEDRRRISRERNILIAERVAHVNRIKGLLFSQGIRYEPLRRDRRA